MRRWILGLCLLLALLGTSHAEGPLMKIHALRLKPGQDLKQEIQAYVTTHHIRAGWIMTCVGSLENLRLRLANCQESSQFDGYFEIVSLSGTLSQDGLHLHLSASNSSGQTFGGHLVDGNRVYTTVELVIGESLEWDFTRPKDPETGYPELKITPR